MKAAIFCGSRDLSPNADAKVTRIMDHYLRDGEKHIVIQGDAKGADLMFKRAAKGRAEVRSFPAEWEKYGKSAGFKRNSLMLSHLLGLKEQGHDVYVIALVPDQLTKGTAMMVRLATDAGVPVSIFSMKNGLIRAH